MHEYDRAAQAGRYGKPVIWGEQGIDGTGGTDGQEPRLTNDVSGIWLHKLTWARTGAGGVYPLYWYTDNIAAKKLHWRYGNWNRFMAGVPLNNGHYADAQASVSDTRLRAWGQKDLTAGRAHLWIDNSLHTWRAVVDASNVPPVTASVTIPMTVPNARYLVKWFDTTTGTMTYASALQADAGGQLTLAVTNLATDTAVQILSTQAVPPRPRLSQLRFYPGGTLIQWSAAPGYTYRVQFKDDLATGSWDEMAGPVTPPGLIAEKLDESPMKGAQRFYRVFCALP
jgi:hypothetical protein